MTEKLINIKVKLLFKMYRNIVNLILKNNYVIAFTGAGISAESGIPTFRGKDGLWNRYNPAELASPEGFRNNPKRVWEWYRWRMEIISKAKPNMAHRILAKLEQLGYLKAIITQNVDGLHQRAGAKNIIELHGNIWRVKCIKCDYNSKINEPPQNIPPKCPKCNALLRPDVIWFGEALPQNQWNKAVIEVSKADLMFVIGTSLLVYPAAQLPMIVINNGGKIIEINLEPTYISNHPSTIWIKSRAAEFFKELSSYINDLNPK